MAAPFCLVALNAQAAIQQVSLSGDNAEGYLAIVGVNQEGNQTLDGISNDPTDPKFFDYPAYINPNLPANVFIMYVEPYQFGLTYQFPQPGETPPVKFLHPNGPSFSSLQDVGPLVQRNPDGSVPTGATFVDGFTEDADFHDFDIGTLSYDDSTLTGVGTEFIAASDITLALDGSDFEAINRTDLDFSTTGINDSPPFGPEGRSNGNEAANSVSLSASGLSGDGLTFVDGKLTSMDFTGTLTVTVSPAAGAGPLDVTATGTVTFSGLDFAFDVDTIFSNFFVSNGRGILNRSGTIDLPLLLGDFNHDGLLTIADIDGFLAALAAGASATSIQIDLGDFTGDELVTIADIDGFLTALAGGSPLAANEALDAFAEAGFVVPEPTVATFGVLSLLALGTRRMPRRAAVNPHIPTSL
ncbi:MAG: hypothetical protein AAGI54_12995 [Planctomycetota bacterium]